VWTRWYFLRRLFLIVLLICGCADSVTPARFRTEGNHAKHVFIVHDAWHAAIVIRTIDIPAAVLPELRDFPFPEHLEFSWGDRDYFPAPDPGVGLALKAAFWSSGSILHVVGSNGAVEKIFFGAEILEIGLSEDGFQRLIKFISDTFSRSSPGVPAEARPGLSPNGRFYLAEGKFSILRTCNTWVAEALSAAGLPVSPRYVITARSLGAQLRSLAVSIDSR
jgi:uncharacterized protein (TIGR02117 family)